MRDKRDKFGVEELCSGAKADETQPITKQAEQPRRNKRVCRALRRAFRGEFTRDVTENQSWKLLARSRKVRRAWPRSTTTADAPPRTLPHAALPSRAQHRLTPPCSRRLLPPADCSGARQLHSTTGHARTHHTHATRRGLCCRASRERLLADTRSQASPFTTTRCTPRT